MFGLNLERRRGRSLAADRGAGRMTGWPAGAGAAVIPLIRHNGGNRAALAFGHLNEPDNSSRLSVMDRLPSKYASVRTLPPCPGHHALLAPLNANARTTPAQPPVDSMDA